MRRQTKAYARGRKVGAIVLAVGLVGLGGTYLGELVSASVAPATHGPAWGLSLASDSLPGQLIVRASKAQPGSARPEAQLRSARPQARPGSARPQPHVHSAPERAPRPKRERTELGPVQMQGEVLAGQRDAFAGSLAPRLQGRRVLLQVRQHEHWQTVARTRTGARSRYELSYVPTGSETVAVRVLFAGGATSKPTHRRLGLLNVYRLALASWYGSGGVTACGALLTSSTLGVANKTLPCGTMVTLRYSGRSVKVPVIDRGPFVPGREFDLTEATKNALGFEGVGDVWAIY